MPTSANLRNSKLNRAVEIIEVLNAIYGEGIPNTSNLEQVRPDPRGHEANTGSARIHLPHLRKNAVHGSLGDRSPACEELEEDAGREAQAIR